MWLEHDTKHGTHTCLNFIYSTQVDLTPVGEEVPTVCDRVRARRVRGERKSAPVALSKGRPCRLMEGGLRASAAESTLDALTVSVCIAHSLVGPPALVGP